MTPPPLPSPAPSPPDVGDAVHGALVIMAAVRQWLWSFAPRDPRRRFSSAERSAIIRRAGGRCEHHVPLVGRCRRTRPLDADHVHPYSKGGQTNIANGQALCTFHNRRKGARVPSRFALRRLAKRRTRYFPPGMPGHVVRRA